MSDQDNPGTDVDEAHREHVERTRRICATDVAAANLRDLLLRLEQAAHATGWDGPDSRPRVFSVDTGPGNPGVHHQWSEPLTALLHRVCDSNGGRGGQAVLALGTSLEKLLNAGTSADQDALPGHQPGWTFHGYGIRTEAWTARDTEDGEVRRLSRQHRLNEYAGRQEQRIVLYIARDGLLWLCIRKRGRSPFVAAIPPESLIGEHSGLIVHGLSRMVNAVASNPVPIRPITHSGQQSPPPPRNPLFRQ